MIAIKLRFNTPVHLGHGREEMDKSELIYHSDSLKSAIYSIGIRYYPEWLNPEQFFPAFRISSCFPFAGQELFLPKPNLRTRFHLAGGPEEKSAKKIKRIEFISLPVFEQILSKDESLIEITEENIGGNGRFLFAGKEGYRKMVYQADLQQRVVVGAVGQEERTRPFYLDRIYFEEECGLFFLASFANEIIKEQVYTVLAELGETGIGTDRTVGNGLFSFDPKTDADEHFKIPAGNTGRQMNLGLYLPEAEEFKTLNLEHSHWSLVKRGGYMAGSNEQSFRHLQRKSIYMFAEGSIFSTQTVLKGKYLDLKPEWDKTIHPVWRCGMPLMLTI